MKELYFNKNLKYLTSNTIITQSELSRILGISRQAVHNLIIKDTDLRISTVLKISEVYDIDISELLFTDLELKYKDKKLSYKRLTEFKKEDN
ncbi:MAG: helix-turn-helix transcriptional regulator [Acholeplasmatales bacterium]|nr:helix-turn-helix transcriptional regulator [Acholeplasmatales bacterium]